jgi:anti-sigma regulatory factor (Ser/Thr protein kinase)
VISVTNVFERQLPRTVEAPMWARVQLKEWFEGELDQDRLHTAKLLTSELVTNAVVHGSGQITLRAGLDSDRLVVEVIDEGSGFEHDVRQQDFDQLGGLGLHIVDAAASRWGVREGTTHVWFELERPGPRIGKDEQPPEL